MKRNWTLHWTFRSILINIMPIQFEIKLSLKNCMSHKMQKSVIQCRNEETVEMGNISQI